MCWQTINISFNYFSFYGNSVFYSVALPWTFLCGSRTWVQMCCRLWLALYQSSQVTHWPLCGCQWPCPIVSTLSTSLSRLTQVRDISIVAFITAITTGCCCYGWPLEGGHQELSSTRLLCCISCYASINKCSMYCLETSVVRKVKSFLMWTNIKSLAQITLCMYFHCVSTEF